MIKLCCSNRKYVKSFALVSLIYIVSCSSGNEIDRLVRSMTLDEKIGQMTQVDYRYLQDITDIKKYFLGSILSGGGATPPKNQPSS